MKKDRWIINIFFLSFFLAVIFSGITNYIGKNDNMFTLTIITFIVVVVGIIFDIVGTSVLISKESTFHAMAAKKIRGARESVNLLKKSSLVANICNDVIGDVCGIVSGGLGTVLAINICIKYSLNITITTIILSAVISSLTVGAKAIGKKISEKHNDDIIFTVGRLISSMKKN